MVIKKGSENHIIVVRASQGQGKDDEGRANCYYTTGEGGVAEAKTVAEAYNIACINITHMEHNEHYESHDVRV